MIVKIILITLIVCFCAIGNAKGGENSSVRESRCERSLQFSKWDSRQFALSIFNSDIPQNTNIANSRANFLSPDEIVDEKYSKKVLNQILEDKAQNKIDITERLLPFLNTISELSCETHQHPPTLNEKVRSGHAKNVEAKRYDESVQMRFDSYNKLNCAEIKKQADELVIAAETVGTSWNLAIRNSYPDIPNIEAVLSYGIFTAQYFIDYLELDRLISANNCNS